jgi:hypothetical protein
MNRRPRPSPQDRAEVQRCDHIAREELIEAWLRYRARLEAQRPTEPIMAYTIWRLVCGESARKVREHLRRLAAAHRGDRDAFESLQAVANQAASVDAERRFNELVILYRLGEQGRTP